MMLPLFLNALNVVRARLSTPCTGTWVADLDVDLDATGILPSGKATLTVGTAILLGTVDPRSSGKFGPKGHVRLVGGGGGWDKKVVALHLHNDFGVLSTAVFSVTAAEVGELVVDALPKRLGVDFVRSAGPASRVLSGFDWHVDHSGVTIVGPRPPVPFNPLAVEILEWDPQTRRATLATGEVVLPGTILVDLRFGKATVRDVEQTFGPDGARTVAWCETANVPAVPGTSAAEVAGSRLARALGALAKESAGVTYLRRYLYRVVIQGADKRVTLQSVSLTTSVPAILQQIDIWPGVIGASATVTPGTEVLVVFIDGDPAQPAVVGFASDAPLALELKFDAVRIAFGNGTAPVMKATPDFILWMAAVTLAVNTFLPGSAVLPVGCASLKAFTD